MLALRHMFSGEPVIGMLTPGQRLEYILDFTSQVIRSGGSLRQRYDVVATYKDATAKRSYSEPHILDLKPWSFAIAEAKPMDVIARQIRRVNENLEKAVGRDSSGNR